MGHGADRAVSIVARVLVGLFFVARAQLKDTTTPVAAKVEICEKRREKNLTVDIYCGQKWAIMNAVNVPEFWEVHELEFYWDSFCTLPLPEGIPISSQVMTTMLDHTPAKVWDEDVTTKWSANCRILLGGCKPYTTFVGKNIGTSTPLNKEPVETWGQVRCVRVFQSINATRQASSISIVTWENRSVASYHIIYTYSDLSGGAWHTRPAQEEAIWRIWNYAPTARPWQVAEVMFFTDLFCDESRQVKGTAISSGSFFPEGCITAGTCDPYLPSRAFDGVKSPGFLLPQPLPSKWIANCPAFLGCGSMEASIGLDFDIKPVNVNCIRIYQPVHEGYPKWGHPHYTSTVMLQSWNGYRWVDRKMYTGLEQGKWSHTMPSNGTAWRVSNFDRIPYSWKVYGVEFYADKQCGGRPMTGVSCDSNPALLSKEQVKACWQTIGQCSKLAFDGDDATAWESSCSPCDQRQAWIGLRLQDRATAQCFKLLQSESVDHRSDAIELAEWMGDHWTTRRFESGIGGGTWNRRPSGGGQMWRLVAMVPTDQPWTVVGLSFYEDDVCNIPLKGNLITSGNEPNYPSGNAFDINDETKWVASCAPAYEGHQGCMEQTAWLGMQKGASFQLRCLRLYQDRDVRKQVTTAALQYWDGMAWGNSPSFPIFNELGGGAWQMLPGFRGSMWRILAEAAPGGHGVGFSELSFFRNSDCTGHLPMGLPNVVPICSGFATAKEVGTVTGYKNHYYHMGELSNADPNKAFDGQLHTFWAEVRQGPIWLGLDFSTQVADVQCIKMAIAGIRSLQPARAELQGWNGKTWKATGAQAVADATLIMNLPSLGGGGTQRRPAPVDSLWRLQNTYSLPAWIVFEVEFYVDMACRGSPLQGTAIGSAKDAAANDRYNGHRQPAQAFDKDASTYWEADCPNGVCGEKMAWIGLDLEGKTEALRCFRLMQSGRRASQTQSIALAAWKGTDFVEEVRYYGLGGDTWNQRPAPPDTMWRINYVKRANEKCPGTSQLTVRDPVTDQIVAKLRSWGVSELEFYSDDACSDKLPGPKEGVDVIASGSRPIGLAPTAGTGPVLAFDGSTSSVWSAQCAANHINDIADCRENYDYIGLDFNRKFGGLPVEVKCVKLTQSRSPSVECCDPADTVTLQRWNGTNWKTTDWRHVADTGEVVIVNTIFSTLAPCADISAEQLADITSGRTSNFAVTVPVEAKRNRKQSETCVIPSPGSVKLLSDPFCEKHPICVAAAFEGNCCPLDSGMSRCCCSFNNNRQEGLGIFEDERLFDSDRNMISNAPPVGFELIMIQSATVMPFIGLVLSFFLICTYLVPFPSGGTPEDPTCAQKIWYRVCGPTHRWLHSGEMLPALLLMLAKRRELDKTWTVILKRLLILIFGFLMGCMLLWMILSYLIAELVLKIILSFSFFIRAAKSRYKPNDPGDQRRLMVVLGIPIGDPAGGGLLQGIQMPNIGAVLGGAVSSVVQGLFAIIQAAFDVILVRFAFMNLQLPEVDAKLSPLTILKQIPNPGLDVSAVTDFGYQVIQAAEDVYLAVMVGLFNGVPRCEGPVVIVSAVCLVVITLLLIRWLNYDYFGLLAAAKYSAQKTRPLFQKNIAVGFTAGAQAIIFIAMQCMMLVTSRAISLVQANPFSQESDSTWTCGYPDQDISVITGRIFLLFTAGFTVVVTFVCANGHLMGQDYILRPLGKIVAMKLERLDPDGSSEDGGGFMRTSYVFSQIPTTLGIWIDGWNVDGYLLYERATIYAEELNLPSPCPHCGVAHIPYHDLMKATGKQLSLSYQIFPFGALIGKACEYFNNPPLAYYGKKLKCLNVAPAVEAIKTTKGRKMSTLQSAKYYLQLFIAVVKDWILPLCCRLAAVSVYFVMIYFTLMMTKQNVIEMGLQMFTLIIAFSYLKAFTETFLPALVLFILAAVLIAGGIMAKKQASKSAKPFKYSPVIGQVLHGVTVGFAIGLFFLKDAGMGLQTTLCTVLGSLAGSLASVFVIVYCYALELCPNCDLSGGLCKFFYALLSAFGSVWLLTIGLSLQLFLTMLAGCCLILVPGTTLTFKKSPVGADGYRAPSSLWPLISSFRAASGPFGVCAGVFGALAPYEFFINQMGQDNLPYVVCECLLFGYILGLAYAMTTDQMVEKRAGRYAILLGTTTALACGLLFHWALGVTLGSLVGTITGSIFEWKMMKEADKASYEPPRFAKALVATATPSLGAVSNTVAYMRDESREGQAAIHTNLPTLCRALTPGGSSPKPEDKLEGFGNAYEEYHRHQQEQQLQLYGEPMSSNQVYGEADQIALMDRPTTPQDNHLAVDSMGQTAASFHSYGVPVGGSTESRARESSRGREGSRGRESRRHLEPMTLQKKSPKKTSLAKQARNIKVDKNVIQPPGPRDAWSGGGGAIPGQRHSLVEAASLAAAATSGGKRSSF
eukprot:TRINITY_DN20433_c0_g1_i1.p1 TRINITY_DN20433_c0_g1~~TRINITY_DN20433_c0_g1_i1.p1  ORF type:complete len:2411 (-),score=384.04 TRINITY_DN20433_c0_g1_i1:107-7339(-)